VILNAPFKILGSISSDVNFGGLVHIEYNNSNFKWVPTSGRWDRLVGHWAGYEILKNI
jgi:hypothetical protein